MEHSLRNSQNLHFSRKLIYVVTGFLLGGSLLLVLTNFSLNLMAAFRDYTSFLAQLNSDQQRAISYVERYAHSKNLTYYQKYEELRAHQLNTIGALDEFHESNPNTKRIFDTFESEVVYPSELSALIFVFNNFDDWTYIPPIRDHWKELRGIEQKLTKHIQRLHQSISSPQKNGETQARRLDKIHTLQGQWNASFNKLMTSVDRAILGVKHFGLWTSVILGILLVLVGVVVTVRANKSINKWEENLREKETLLSEIHHRVKNNLAVISGLLELETMQPGNPEQALKESRDRIQSMATIHEMLYQSKSFSDINFSDYIYDLSKKIQQTHITDQQNIQFDYHIEDVNLSINQAVPFGLILNEVLTNTIEHAFQSKENGRVGVELTQDNDQILLKISDNGKGLPHNMDQQADENTGFAIIQALVQQLDANMDIRRNGGTTFTLSFQRSDHSGSGSHHF